MKEYLELETFSQVDFFRKYQAICINTKTWGDVWWGEREEGRGWVSTCRLHCQKTAVNKITKLIII